MLREHFYEQWKRGMPQKRPFPIKTEKYRHFMDAQVTALPVINITQDKRH